jgi:FAD/FMN-containing dehydrogenase
VTIALDAFAAEVGTTGTVRVVGGRTQWDVGGLAPPDVREVTAPAGVVSHEPAEMVVRVAAATTLEELRRVVRAGGQDVALESDFPAAATVGGILAVGRSGYRRLGWGPVRDAVLEVTAVTAKGDLVRAGAPLVKNVTGFDLCRLLVGSLGTLALIGEVVLRCRPQPQMEGWWASQTADPFRVAKELYRPLSVLWNGTTTWVGLAGYEPDVVGQADTVLGAAFVAVAGPPAPPGGPLAQRRSLPPGALAGLPEIVGRATPAGRAGVDGRGGTWLAEVGVGVVHLAPEVGDRLPATTPPAPALVALHQRLKERFDPNGRFNPGRSPLIGAPR